MKKKLVIILFVIPVIGISQTSKDPLLNMGQGIHFEQDLNWEQVKAKAQAENKYIFMDCFASWCGPCKWMSKNIFSQKDVGDYFNAHFISVAVQIDETNKDSKTTVNWYKDAKMIESKYSINSYPTYLFFSPDGGIVHRHINTSKDAKEFISIGFDALLPDKQYYTIFKHISEFKEDSALLVRALTKALKATDYQSASIIAALYSKCIRNPYDIENLKLIIPSIQSSSDSLFGMIVNNYSRIDSVFMDPLFIEYRIAEIFVREEIEPVFHLNFKKIMWKEISSELKRKYPKMGSELVAITEKYLRGICQDYIEKTLLINAGSKPNWRKVLRELNHKMPEYNFNEIVANEKPRYYAKVKRWDACAGAAISLLNKYGPEMGAGKLNSIVWNYVFSHSNNLKLLGVAQKWSKRSIELDTNSYYYLDTFANLLYKIGKKDEAVAWEAKAVDKIELDKRPSNKQSTKEIFNNFEKMKKGEKTWVD